MKNGQRTRGEKKPVLIDDGLSVEEAEELLKDYARMKAFEAEGRSSIAMHMEGVLIVPIEEKEGDYAELVDADGKPIPPVGYNPNVDITKWWVKCSTKDGKLVWMMPYAAWQVHRDIAAAKWYDAGWAGARERMAARRKKAP